MDSRSYWIFQLFAWGFQSVQMGLLAATMPQFFRWDWVGIGFAKMGILALVSHGVVRILKANRWYSLKRTALVIRGLGIGALGAIIPTSLFFHITRGEWGGFYQNDSLLFLSDWLANFTILAMWGAFFLAFQFHELNRRSEVEFMRLKADSKEAELATLKSQLNPHFLFNSFNLLRALIQRQPDVARDAVTHLAEMMRHSLTLAPHDTISLARELDFVESYLVLERLRFQERLRVEMRIGDDCRVGHIPSMLLYTLVENAVKYGIDQDRGGVDVTCSIRKENGNFLLRVTNSGKLVERGSSTGTGLLNIRGRLELLYGEHASIDVFQQEGEVIAEVKWPALKL